MIENNDRVHYNPDQKRWIRFASIASVTTAVLLIAVKLVAWFMTGSLSVMATLLDSLLDAGSSILTLVAIQIALQPADKEHRFGHGKAEQLAALAQAAFISGSSIMLLFQVVDGFISGPAVHNENLAMGVMVFSIVATMILLMIQREAVRRTGSVAIQADSMHYRVDIITNLTVVAALVLSSWGYPDMDALFALLIGLYMMYGVKEIGWEAIQNLMDRSLPEEDETEIERLAQAVPGVEGVHELRTRRSGTQPIIQLHLDVPGSISVQQAHDLSDQVEEAILQYMPGADIIVHHDPV
ncbi:cation diffusion facilitator family transporter [Spongorhabdus nitratireducens]